ncbi:GumC family protein [Desulfobacter curvatus]|uniref:GumC family protein n=1 Tax=Desulfobacter curvatus TaxID=2290 RepID=UPI00036BB669|nr:GumC family protein [Desulfobacter curvatus]
MTSETPEQINEEEIHLSDYLNVVLNHKGLILSFLLITVVATAIFTFSTKPVYQAASKLVIGMSRNVSPLSGQSYSMDSFYVEEKNFNTHFKLIASKPVLKMVAQEVDLSPDTDQQAANPLVRYMSRVKENIKLVKTAVKDFIKQLLPESDPALEVGLLEESIDTAYRQLLSMITVNPVDETRIMEIVAKDTDPQRARDIANAVAQKYIEFDLSTKLKSSTDKLNWMTNELYGVKKKLEDAEKEFIDYKQSQKMFSMEGRQTLITQKIASFNRNYLEIKNKKLELDTTLQGLRAAMGNSANIMRIKSLVDDPIIKDLYSILTSLEIEKGHLSKVYKPKHPKIVEVVSKIENTGAKLRSELEKKMVAMKRERDILANQEREIKKQIAEFENEAMQTSEKELAYNIYQRNVNTSQQLYDILLSQVKESNILQSSDASNLTIVETADLPEEPVKPNKKRNFLLSIVLGLFGGVGLAFFLEYLNQTIRNEEDAERFLGYPVIAVVPDASLKNASYGGHK